MENRTILTDIGGTTTPNNDLRTILDDFRDNCTSLLTSTDPETMELLAKSGAKTGLSGEKLVQFLYAELNNKVLDPDYLTLMGTVNTEGYRTGRLVGEFFDDVPVAFDRWSKNGQDIFVYSNGSEEFQQIKFQKARQGDLSKYIKQFFDTAKVGGKYEVDSYKRINDAIGVNPQNIVFLSDLEKELSAADKAGFGVILVERPGNKPQESDYRRISSFLEI